MRIGRANVRSAWRAPDDFKLRTPDDPPSAAPLTEMSLDCAAVCIGRDDVLWSFYAKHDSNGHYETGTITWAQIEAAAQAALGAP